MNEPAVRGLRRIAAVAASVVAGIHLLHPTQGAPALLAYARVGMLGDPRPLAFTLSGLAIVAGILLVYNGIAVRPVYVAGIGLCLVYLLGYAAWHTVLAHGGFWPAIRSNPVHGGNPLVVVAEHLARDPVELASKLSEATLLALLAALYRVDR